MRLASNDRTDADLFAGVPGFVPAAALQDFAALPDVLSEILHDLDDDVTCGTVCRDIVERIRDTASPVKEALLDVAAAADRSGGENAYHNPTHSRDVGLVFANLLRLQAVLSTGTVTLSESDLLLGCCAAFGHDIGHDGRDGGPDSPPFRLERIAAETVGAALDRKGIAPDLVDRVRCAILATDAHRGYAALDQARRGALPSSPDLPAGLHALRDKQTCTVAFLLRDADVMQSAGLTPEDHDRQTARLEQERGLPSHAMGARGADIFLRDVIGGRFLSEAGRVFQPRLDRLLALNARRAASGRDGASLAAIKAS